MIFGSILAGGLGTRMNISDMPKQFLLLGNKPIIIHTLEKFLMCNQFDCVYIGVHQQWISYMKDIISKYNLIGKKIQVVAGGNDRNTTIMNIIQEIEEKHGESSDHIIVTHDAVRPFVSLRIIRENIESVLKHDAVDTVISASDTIVASENGQYISHIPERSKMYQGQTPQSFRIECLKNLYHGLTKEEKEVLTDACKICVVRDIPVYLIKGEISNFKITTIDDYKIAQKCLEED